MAVDTLDILTPDEALRALSLSEDHTAWSDEIEQLNTGVSRDIDDACGPVVIRTVTDELHDGLTGSLFLRYQPVVAVSAVTEYRSGTGTVLTAETTTASGGYLLDTELGTIARRSGFYGQSWSGRVKVTYTAGRYATTATVDRRFKAAAADLLRARWLLASPTYRRSQDFDLEQTAAALNTTVMLRSLLPGDLKPQAVA